MAEPKSTLSLPRTLAFASVGIPLAAIGLPMAVYVIPLYAEELGVGLAATGTIFMFLRLWDLITDPVMGWLVDTKTSTFGRVRHWLAVSVPVLGLAAFFIYMPASETVSPWYLAGWLVVFYVGFTLLQTPHAAWVPAIAPGYDERSRLFMWFEIFQTFAMLAMLLAPPILSIWYDFDRRTEVWYMGLLLLVSLPLTIGLAARYVPDPKIDTAESKKFKPSAYLTALKNFSLTRILLAYISVGIAVASTASTYLWAAKWGFGLTTAAPLVLAFFFISGFVSIPFWIGLSKRTEKHTTFRIICAFSAISFLLYFPLYFIGGLWPMALGAVLSGTGFTSAFVLARSMVADLVEEALANDGEDRAGVYYALLSSAYKLGASFAIGIPYLLLSLIVGFNPAAENSPETVRNMMLVFAGVPATFYMLAAVLLSGYKLTRAVQEDNALRLTDGPIDIFD